MGEVLKNTAQSINVKREWTLVVRFLILMEI